MWLGVAHWGALNQNHIWYHILIIWFDKILLWVPWMWVCGKRITIHVVMVVAHKIHSLPRWIPNFVITIVINFKFLFLQIYCCRFFILSYFILYLIILIKIVIILFFRPSYHFRFKFCKNIPDNYLLQWHLSFFFNKKNYS